MKTRSILWAIMVSFLFLPVVWGQQFQDLNFESATLVPVSGDPYGDVEFAPAFPGWTQTIMNPLDPNALYDNLFLDSAGIGIFDNIAPGFPSGYVIQDRYTAVLQSGNGYAGGGVYVPSNATLSQTGLVPPGTESLEFEANTIFDSHGTFGVTLGGQTLSLKVLGIGSNYTLYGADVSQWAGQTAQLTFTVFAEIPHMHDETLLLDAIQFSSQPVPEPDLFGLLGLGGLLFGLRRFK